MNHEILSKIKNIGTGLTSIKKLHFDYYPFFTFYDNSEDYEKQEIPALFRTDFVKNSAPLFLKFKNHYITYNMKWKDCHRDEYFICDTVVRNTAKPSSYPIMVGFTYDDGFDIKKYVVGQDGPFKIIKYGNYPQSIVDFKTQLRLNKALFDKKMISTDNTYTFPLANSLTSSQMKEYIYEGECYALLVVYGKARHVISVGKDKGYNFGDDGPIGIKDEREYTFTTYDKNSIGHGIWFKVKPIEWFVDEDAHMALSEKILLRLTKKQFRNDNFLNKHFRKEIVYNVSSEYKNNDTDELKELLDKIYDTILVMPNDFQTLIIKKVDDLINKYTSNIASKEITSLNLKENDSVNLTIDNSNNYSVELIIELRNILYFLAQNNEYKELINEMDSYQKVLKKEKFILPDEMNTINDMLEGIGYYANLMDDGNKKRIINEVLSLLNKPKEEFLLFLNNSFTDTLNLTTNYENNPRLNLKLALSSYLDEIKVFYNQNENGFKLLKTFANLSPNLYSDSVDSIFDMINNIWYVLSKIEVANVKVDLVFKFKEIKKKYTEIILKVINSSQDNYEEILLNMCRELEPFFDKLDNYANNQKIINEVYKCRKIINNLMVVEDDDKSVIISITNDFVKLFNNYDLSDEEKTDVKKQVLDFLNWVDTNNDIFTLDEIYKNYMSLYVDIKLLILKNKRDKENIRSNQTVINFLNNYQNEKKKKLQK